MGIVINGLSYWQAEAPSGEPLIEQTIGDLFDQQAAAFPAQEAVVYTGHPEYGSVLDLRWTYQEYHARVQDIARGLLALGLQKGEYIAIWGLNLPEWLLIQMAAAKAGLVLVTINPLLREAEVEYILRQGDVRALFFMPTIRDHDCLATMCKLTTPGTGHGMVTGERLPLLRSLRLIGASLSGFIEQADWRPTLFAEIIADGVRISEEEIHERQALVTPHDPALLLYTSVKSIMNGCQSIPLDNPKSILV